MSKDWDYAQLTHNASKAGGPEKFVDKVFSKGKESGKKELTPKMIGGGVALLGIGYGISKAVDKLKEVYNKKRKEEERIAKEQYVNELKEKYELEKEPVNTDLDNKEN